MFFTQYVSSTFLILIQLYVFASVQAATYIQNMNPLIQAPLAPLLQAIPGLVSQDTKLIPPVYGQGSFDQDKEQIMNQVMHPNLGPGLPVTSILGQQPALALHHQGNTLQNHLDLLKMLGIRNSTLGGNASAPYADITEVALQQQKQQQQQSHYDEHTKQPTHMHDNSAVTSKKDEHTQSTGGSSDVNLKGKEGVCEDHPDCALLPMWTCIADDVVWDDCPKMCGQCPKKEADTTDAKLPKPLTPDQLSKQLKPAIVPTLPLPNQQLLVSQGLKQPLPAQMTMQQLALSNLLGQLQGQQLPLANLLPQQGIASPNPTLQLQPLYSKLMPQLQQLLSPMTTLPQQGILPQPQCFCSKLPIPKDLQALLQLQSPLNNIMQHQPQSLLQSQSPLQNIIQHQPQSLLQPQSPLNNIMQHQPQSLLQPQSPLQKIIQRHPQALLQPWALLPKIIQGQPQAVLQPQSPLQKIIQSLPQALLQSHPLLQKIMQSQPHALLQPHSQLLPLLNIQRQLQTQPPTSGNLNQHSSACQQLTDMLSNMQQTNFLQGATQQNPLLQVPNHGPLNLNQVLKSLAVSPLKIPNIPLQNLNPLNILNANPKFHNPGINLLHVGHNPIQDTLKQLQTQLLNKKIYNPQLGSGNKHLQLNALRNLQSQKSVSSPAQILQANILQNLHNLKTLGSRLPMDHHLGNNRLLRNNIINSLLTPNLAMNRAPIKRSTKLQKPSGEMGLFRNLVQPLNAVRDTKNINAKNIAGLWDILPVLQLLVPSNPSSLNSIIKTANKSAEDQDATAEKNLLGDAKLIAEEYEHLNSKENSLTKTSEESQTGSIKNLATLSLQLNETLSEDNLRKRSSNSNISENESSTEALSEESISRDELSSNHPNGGLLLASQLLKEARSDLSTIDNIISSYSTNENELSKLSSEINEDRSIVSQDQIRSDISFDGINESEAQDELEAVVETKPNDGIRYNDKLSPEDGSIQNLSEKKESTNNITQLESLLESRLETSKKTESLSSAISLNDKSTGNALGVVSKLVSEAQSDISKIQDNLKETFSLQGEGQKEKRESVPQQNDILQAENLLNNANLDLSSIHESLRKAKALNDVNLKHSNSEVIDNGGAVDTVLIGSKAEYANSPRVKRVLNDHEYFLDY